MEEYNILRMQDRLKEYLARDRFIHTQGVMYTATALAMCHGEDLVKAQVAGLLHDCAKCIPTGKKLKICKKNDIALTKWEEENEALLHAKVGVYIAKKKYGITDPEILNAIRYHTTGKADMTSLEKIVYIADYIEPGRYTVSYDGSGTSVISVDVRSSQRTSYLSLSDPQYNAEEAQFVGLVLEEGTQLEIQRFGSDYVEVTFTPMEADATVPVQQSGQ